MKPHTFIHKVKESLLVLALLPACLLSLALVTGCSDDPDSDNYYVFKGEMMDQYLKTHEQFSEFAEIVQRAGMMDLLSAYGHYTCFAPTNDAVNTYLKGLGKNSVSDLSDADCDTIARTHLVDNMYITSEMYDGTLPTANMNNRFIEVTHALDSDSNSVVRLNRSANILFTLQDDSVENGIMQPIDGVLTSSSRMLANVLKDNPRISIFDKALEMTHLEDSLYAYRDASYNAKSYPRIRYVSHVNKETATVPDEKKRGFTAFVPTDDVLEKKYGITNVQQLYQKACEIYDKTYPEDANAPYHSIDSVTNRKNPLNRLIAYHILTRDVVGWNLLTPRNDIGIVTTQMNPVDWYQTMLPHTMLKFERLTVVRYAGPSELGQRYVNRRYDDDYKILGAKISQTVEEGVENTALNGRYFYVDDLLAFDEQTRDIVDGVRIRMDMSTVFPELMTMNIRQNGDASHNDPEYDETAKYGRNYYFPNGYLDGVTVNGNLIYRRPHNWYDSYEGDEMNMFGNFDITFKLPPVPFEGDWQIRLGYASEGTRGIAQVYFGTDPKNLTPQGIPLDMTHALNDPAILGSKFVSNYSSMTSDQKARDQKALKNLGFYRGAAGGYRVNGEGHPTGYSDRTVFVTVYNVQRIVLCTVHIDPNKDHYLRFRCVSTKKGNDNEFDLDYIELVPKSVYGVTDDGEMEDDL